MITTSEDTNHNHNHPQTTTQPAQVVPSIAEEPHQPHQPHQPVLQRRHTLASSTPQQQLQLSEEEVGLGCVAAGRDIVVGGEGEDMVYLGGPFPEIFICF